MHPLNPDTAHPRVLELLKRHGWSATSFQVLEPGYSYWFEGEDACVAYVDTGRAWVVAGGPIAPLERMAEVASRFQAHAAASGRRVCFFATEQQLLDEALEQIPLHTLAIGEQPVWDPRRWEECLREGRNLRGQLRMARVRGVQVREVSASELREASSPVRAGVDRLMTRWLESRRMAPMGFLVQLSPYAWAEERRSFVAECNREVVAFLSAVPVYARQGWFVQHLLRGPETPGGTVALLVDAVMRAAAAAGCGFLTLGLVPLAGEVDGWLRAARRLGAPFYDFEGLRAFKARLRPHAWERVHLVWPVPQGSAPPVVDALTAFAQGSLTRFGLASLLRRPQVLVWVLALLLVPWTVMLALPASTPRFPSPLVQGGWVLFDMGLMGALFSLVQHWRPWLATLLASVITADASATLLQALAFNLPRARGPADWLVLGVAVLAPSLAAGLLFWTRRHPALEPG